MIEVLRNRRSIRKYEQRPIELEKVEILKEALLRAPSSRSINPWEFIFVDDKEVLRALSKAKEHGSSFLERAALGIVVCGDEQKSDVWVEDCSIASIIVQLVVVELGLGSCWIQIRNRMHNDTITAEDYIRELLNIPGRLKVESIVSIGYPAEVREPLSRDKLQYDKIKLNSY